jgi:hypothetical protein
VKLITAAVVIPLEQKPVYLIVTLIGVHFVIPLHSQGLGPAGPPAKARCGSMRCLPFKAVEAGSTTSGKSNIGGIKYIATRSLLYMTLLQFRPILL